MAIRRIPRNARVCYIYIMESAGLLKVGWSEEPAARVRDLQTGSPLPIRLVHIVPCPSYAIRKVELAAHKRLEAFHVRGEWHDVELLVAVSAVHDAMAESGQRVLTAEEVGRELSIKYLESLTRKKRSAIALSVAKARVSDFL